MTGKIKKYWKPVAGAAYCFAAIIAFGHSAGNNQKTCPPAAKFCFESDMKLHKATAGIAAGMLWPLYWSWVAFESGQDQS